MADVKTPTPKTPSAPPVVGPPPTTPAGMTAFQAQMDAALSQIVTDPPSGPVLPAVSVSTPEVRGNPEETAILAHRAMLAEEEKRLEARRASAPPPVNPAPAGFVPSAFGSSVQELVVREGADPLHVESFKILRRLVAGGSPLLATMDAAALTRHMTALREKIEYRAPTLELTPPAKKPVVDE